MYKHNSENEQRRRERRALQSRKNEHGVDTTAFNESTPQEDIERNLGQMLHDKLALEGKIADINARIRRAKGSFGSNRPDQMGYDQVAQWESQRANMVGRLNRLNVLITKHKSERRIEEANREDSLDRLPNIFMSLAKEMLAEEVYNRVFIAAVHRVRERE